MTTPALAGLRSAYPGARITLQLWPGSRPGWLDDVQQHGNLFDATIHDDTSGEFKGPIGTTRWIVELRRGRYTAAITMHGGTRAAWTWWSARIPVRIGNAVKPELKPLFTYNEDQGRLRPSKHEVEYNYELLRPLGVTGKPGPMLFPSSTGEVRDAATLLASNGIDLKRPIVIVNPTHGGSSRPWPIHRFAEVARIISQSRNAQIVLVGAEALPESRVLLNRIGESAFDLSGQTPLPLLAAILRLSTMHISVDTGTMHLAAACRTPCVTLIPVGNLWDQKVRWRPWSVEHALIGPIERCSDCVSPYCTRTQTACIDSITVDSVVKSALGLFGKVQSQP